MTLSVNSYLLRYLADLEAAEERYRLAESEFYWAEKKKADAEDWLKKCQEFVAQTVEDLTAESKKLLWEKERNAQPPN